MNSHASPQCARRLLMALAAIASIIFIAGCSSGNIATPNNNGFTNSNLSGTYVISIAGTDVNLNAGTESFFTIVGTIQADGMGNIQGGTVDINDLNLGGTGVFTGQTVGKTNYSVSPDGRGTGTLSTPIANFGLDFVLTSNDHGLITRFDGSGSGSGTLDLQGSATQSSLQSLAFSLSGSDSGGNPLGTVGAFTLNSAGTVTTGVQDFNDAGSSGGIADLPIANTSSLVLASGTNGTAQLNTDFGSFSFDVWVIDSTHLKFIETDGSGLATSGDAFTQQTSFTAGQLVFAIGGADLGEDPVAAGGYATTDVNGNLINGFEDFNNAGNAVPSVGFAGSCLTFVAGRCQLAMTGFTNGLSSNLQFAAYPSSGGILLLQDDSAGITQGTAYTQTATSFAQAGYGLNLSGVNACGNGTNCEVDTIAQFNAGSPTSNPNVTGILDENDITTPNPHVSLSGLYTPDSPATGRGSISDNNIGTLIGTLNLEYYVVDPSDIVFIQVDTEQVSVGLFQLQTSQQGGVKPQVLTLHAVLRPRGAHASWKHK
jgi:hypothetical protein